MRIDSVAETVAKDLVRGLINEANQHDGTLMDNALEFSETLPVAVQPFLAWDDDRLLGVLTVVGERSRESYLTVRPSVRRRGTGRSLVNAARAWCQEVGASELLLVSDTRSSSAPPFLATLGAEYRFSEYRVELRPPTEWRFESAIDLLRSATVEDLDTLVTITAAAFGHVPAAIRGGVAAMLRATQHRWYVAEVGGTAVGAVRTTIHADSASIHALGVLPDQQRRGHGRRMLSGAVAALRRAGQQEIWLEVAIANRHALELFRSRGFRETATYRYDAVAC